MEKLIVDQVPFQVAGMQNDHFNGILAELSLEEDEVIPLTILEDGAPFTKKASLSQVPSKRHSTQWQGVLSPFLCHCILSQDMEVLHMVLGDVG